MIFIEIIRQTIMITSLVLVMMLLIEYFNVLSHGRAGQSLSKSKFKQIVVSALLGLVPGCIGGFAVVGMFTHGFVNFGALTASMLASTGDESFVMLSMFPEKAILLNLVLFVLAVVVGVLVNYFTRSLKTGTIHPAHMVIHSHDTSHQSHSWRNIRENIRKISFQRAVLIFGLLMFVFGIVTGQFEHGGHEINQSNASSGHIELGFENIIFVILTLVVLFLLLVVDEHFLEEHIWEHIVKKHFLRIFLWTFGALLGIELLIHFMDFTPWLQKNQLWVLGIALIIGIIPESGPHLIFVTLFFSGTIPMSILMANSIVQDGHSSLPLLAESKRSFFIMKGINLMVGLAVGLAGYFWGW